MDWNVQRSIANSRVFLHGLHFTNSFKVSCSKSNERSGLGSSINDVSPEQKFGNQFRIWRSVMTTWP